MLNWHQETPDALRDIAVGYASASEADADQESFSSHKHTRRHLLAIQPSNVLGQQHSADKMQASAAQFARGWWTPHLELGV